MSFLEAINNSSSAGLCQFVYQTLPWEEEGESHRGSSGPEGEESLDGHLVSLKK